VNRDYSEKKNALSRARSASDLFPRSGCTVTVTAVFCLKFHGHLKLPLEAILRFERFYDFTRAMFSSDFDWDTLTILHAFLHF
jgi:hypothetical protein